MTKLVVVTGASGGMGRQTCKVFKDHGYLVIGTDVHESQDLSVDHFFQGEITHEVMWQEIAKHIQTTNGQLNSLINCWTELSRQYFRS
jgi:NAD(P)-dependent dehydrogenase (short-subunit alcohol dehydrogenase family)